MPLSVGDIAPDFTLTRRVGEDPVQLSRYGAGQTRVLLFFPLAFSSVCTDEMCQIAKSYDRWDDVGAWILGVSVDSPFVNARFAEETGVAFPLLSDFNREVCTAYGVRNDDYFGMKGVADRSAFVLDGDRKVTYVWTIGDEDELPPYAEIMNAVAGAS